MTQTKQLCPVDRRLFLKGAALGLLAYTVLGIDSVAFAAKASDETLAALSGAQAEYEAAMAELASLGEELEMAQYYLSECEANLQATNDQIAELETYIAQRQVELEDAQNVLSDRVRASYTAGSTRLLDVLFEATSFDDFVSRLYYAGKVSDSDAEAIENVKAIKADLEQQTAALQEQRAEQERLLSEQQDYADQVDAAYANCQSYVAGLSAEVTALMNQAQQELIAAQQAEYEAYLAQQAAEQAAAQQAAALQSGGDGNSEPSYSEPSYSEPSYSEPSYSEPSYSEPSYDDSSWSGSYGGGNHVSSVADIAWGYIGVPYVWGGTSPSGFDCSGLAQYCYAMAGYSIGRTTYDQAANISARGQMVYSMSELSPGDLVFPHSGHVGIYMGGGMMIHAPYPGESVKYASVYAFSFGGCPV